MNLLIHFFEAHVLNISQNVDTHSEPTVTNKKKDNKKVKANS